MDRFRISGLPPYDGDYDIDLSYFTNRELHTIKRLSGNRANEIRDAFVAGDNDLIVALVVIALERSKRFPMVVEDAIWDAQSGRVEFVPDGEQQGDDADPPTTQAVQPGRPEEPNGRSVPSGPSSAVPSETPANGQSPTGVPV